MWKLGGLLRSFSVYFARGDINSEWGYIFWSRNDRSCRPSIYICNAYIFIWISNVFYDYPVLFYNLNGCFYDFPIIFFSYACLWFSLTSGSWIVYSVIFSRNFGRGFYRVFETIEGVCWEVSWSKKRKLTRKHEETYRAHMLIILLTTIK